MTLFFRSLLFNICFYGWILFCSILFLPSLLFSRQFVEKITKVCVKGMDWICEHILGLHVKIIGRERFSTTPVVFAVKHQSAWETIIFHSFLNNPAIVLKRDLMWIPFFGWYLKKLQMVPLSRSKKRGVQDLKNLLKAADQAVAQKRPLIIFPEGTRSKPGQKSTYHSGIASLYLHLNIPVIPIAHNAGLYWPRRGFLKYSGCITLELMEPIQPGLSRQEFMRILENKIETTTNKLIREGNAHVKKS